MIACAALRIAALALALCLGLTDRAAAQKAQTTDQANRENIKGAAEAPLRDLNVVRTKVPDVLLLAAADPYRRPKSLTCAVLDTEILPLEEALGPDIDNSPAEDQTSVKDKGRGTALGVVAGAASGVIPFRGLIRKATGAEQHDRFVQDAINAGVVRRAYLKGLGEAKGCPPPATPSHAKTGSPVVEAGKPLYPIR